MTYLRLLIVQSTHIQKINLLFYRLDTSVLYINFKIPSESNLKEQTILSPNPFFHFDLGKQIIVIYKFTTTKFS